MLVISDVDADSRVQREATALHEAGHEVTVIALAGTTTEAYEVLPVSDRPMGVGGRAGTSGLRRALRWALLPTYLRLSSLRFARRALEVVADRDADVVHAHDFSTLHLGRLLADRWDARLVYDAHECWVGRRRDGRDTPVMDLVELREETRLAAGADAVLTVSPMLARWLEHRTGRSVALVRNTFPRRPAEHEQPLPDRPTGIVYAGNVGPGRDLETFAAAELPIAKVTLGRQTGPPIPGLDVRPPVPVDDVDAVYHRHGLALVPLTDDCLNHRVALPNKLFHAIRAGVPVVAADLPQIREVVADLGIGVLYRPGSAASLTTAVGEVMRRHADLVDGVVTARTGLGWAADAGRLVEVFAGLTSGGGSGAPA